MERFLSMGCLLFLFLLGACRNQPKSIANPADYQAYLVTDNTANQTLANFTEDIAFWNTKLQTDTGNYVFMLKKAYLLSGRFRTSGQVEDLFQADTLLHRVNQKLRNTESSVFYALLQNAVTRHQFRLPMDYT